MTIHVFLRSFDLTRSSDCDRLRGRKQIVVRRGSCGAQCCSMPGERHKHSPLEIVGVGVLVVAVVVLMYRDYTREAVPPEDQARRLAFESVYTEQH